jgi:uncharacterized protein YbaR (Trm112 family)
LFIELIDLLRCPRDHEETWLVAAFNEMSARFVITGTLGCLVCQSTYRITAGVADLRTTSNATSAADDHQSDSDAPMRLAAFLNLVRPGMTILLTGGDAAYAPVIGDLTETRVFTVNPGAPVQESERVATVLADSRLPFATASIDGIAVHDESFSMDEFARVLKPGARLVAPASVQLAGAFRELARDAKYVVAEALGPLLTLRR